MGYTNLIYILAILPAIIFFYNIVPNKYRAKALLLINYAFYFFLSRKMFIYLLISSFSIHHIGLWLDSIILDRNETLEKTSKEDRKQVKLEFQKKLKRVLLLGIIIHVGALLLLKYTPFALNNANNLLNSIGLSFRLPIPKILVPVGISFYTLQAVSYMVDVYHEKIKADKNLLRVCLYMSFFPQLMEGPIARYEQTAEQIYEAKRSTYESLCFGAQRILWGLIKKMVVADRVNKLIVSIYTGYATINSGWMIVIGAVLYTIQLYMEFSGTMDVIIGSGEMIQVKLPENFRQPFFSKTISDFWARWHITLGTFFKDYIFYPLSLSKPLKKVTLGARKVLGNHFGPLLAGGLALGVVWFCNGLWHGAAWSFIFFGFYHFVLILTGNIFEPTIKKVCAKLKINRNSWWYKGLQIIKTTILVIIGELFFRAHGLKAGIAMFVKMVTKLNVSLSADAKLFKGSFDVADLIIIIVTLIIVLIVGILREKNINIRESIAKMPIVPRWAIYVLMVLFLFIFGAYGIGYVPIDPIYANF